ncbi:hypothetical protein AVEN_219749-1 [Araneus ventricosus]|uniref:Uncharacterized protein n=1 Tax=Araneus ventricosus TaxID=182803 RepID=A0A4Y2NJR3_ARAVE|nr:hypothetical protein AVEN_219749-1 [Araneus ventricosus]
MKEIEEKQERNDKHWAGVIKKKLAGRQTGASENPALAKFKERKELRKYMKQFHRRAALWFRISYHSIMHNERILELSKSIWSASPSLCLS